ncbi:MAG TPA: alpha/beta hydrolase, partial [Leptospiraceae bacterium]|nr:alpha/beta hydrolase [Leptospiraceae bacterium]
IAFMDNLLWELDIKTKVTLIVHDLGGFYGLTYLAKYPEKVSRIGIFDTLYFTNYQWHFWANIWRTNAIGELSMAIMNYPLFLFELKRGSRKLSLAEIQKMYSYDSPNMRKAILDTYREFSPSKFEGWEDKMKSGVKNIPSFVAWGKHDPYIPVEFAYQFGSDNVHILDCGHWTPAEEKEKSVELIQKLFQEKI